MSTVRRIKMTPGMCAMAHIRGLAACTYQLTSEIATLGETRYVLKRSDGRSVNVDRAAFIRIKNQGKLVGGLNR